MTYKTIRNFCIAAVVMTLAVTGWAAPGDELQPTSGGSNDECHAGLAAVAGALLGGLLARGNNRAKGAAFGAGVASLACVAWNYNVKQTKTAEQVQQEYRTVNHGELPTQSKIINYETRFDPSGKVAPGGKLTLASNIEVVQGTADPTPLIEEELTLVRPDGSEVKSRKKANVNQGAGAFSTVFSMNMPAGVSQGEYPMRTALFLNGERVAGKDMKMQVVFVPGGELVALIR